MNDFKNQSPWGTPPPGGGFDSISMRYKIYIEYY